MNRQGGIDPPLSWVKRCVCACCTNLLSIFDMSIIFGSGWPGEFGPDLLVSIPGPGGFGGCPPTRIV